jgi:hypothetical protein
MSDECIYLPADNVHVETRCIGDVDKVTGKVTNLKLVSCDLVNDYNNKV